MINDDIVVVPYDPAWPGRFAHVHVMEHGGDGWRNHLVFRDYLRTHREARDAYAALKRDLAARYPTDRVTYTDSKEPLITELLKQAHHWDAGDRP